MVVETPIPGLHLVHTGIEPCPHFISTYIVDTGKALIVVDPGPTTRYSNVKRALEELGNGCKEVVVVLTHIHIDHASATHNLVKDYGAKVYVHPRGAKHLANPERLWRASLEVLRDEALAIGRPGPVPRDAIIKTSDGECVDIGGERLCFIHTPGHAPHHQALYLPREHLLFPGDAGGGYVPEVDAVIPVSPPRIRLVMYLDSLVRLLNMGALFIAYAHTGVVESSKRTLQRHGAQVLRWIRVLSRCGTRCTVKDVVEADPEAQRVYKGNVCIRFRISVERSFEAFRIALGEEQGLSLEAYTPYFT